MRLIVTESRMRPTSIYDLNLQSIPIPNRGQKTTVFRENADSRRGLLPLNYWLEKTVARVKVHFKALEGPATWPMRLRDVSSRLSTQ
jgi:hypothetical protein